MYCRHSPSGPSRKPHPITLNADLSKVSSLIRPCFSLHTRPCLSIVAKNARANILKGKVLASFNEVLTTISDTLWGSINSLTPLNIPGFGDLPILAILLLGTGIYLTIALRFMPITNIPSSFVMLWKGRAKGSDDDGQISPFAALMTALSSTVGTGNLAGVATAITLGGPGAIFWMWMTALVGMATKYAESMLAVRYREVDDNGNFTRLDGYALTSLRAAYPVSEAFEIYGRVENLFDVDYQTVTNFGTAGRAGYVGLRARF